MHPNVKAIVGLGAGRDYLQGGEMIDEITTSSRKKPKLEHHA